MENQTITTKNYSWETSQLIGHGGYSKVYKGLEKKTGETVAIKTYKYLVSPIAIRKEADIMRKIEHKNIIKFLGKEIDDNGKTILSIEYCNQGSMANLLEQNPTGLPSELFFRACDDIVNAFMYLYENGVIHRDLKPDNMMVSELNGHFTFKIGDFGSAKMLRHNQEYGSILGTFEYMHPALFTAFYGSELHVNVRFSTFGWQHELWPMGVSLYELAVGHLPFKPIHGRKDKRKMYEMTTAKKDGVIAIGEDDTEVYDLPETCNLNVKSKVAALIAGLLKPTDMWPIEKFEKRARALAKENRPPRRARALAKENRPPRKNHKVTKRRNPPRKAKLAAKWTVDDLPN